ncbi:hypothetical protein KDM41_03715 [bacterium]|nr:hypothetical protein [bacterium]
MKSLLRLTLVLGLAVLAASPAAAGAKLGGGIHYLKTVGDLKDVEGFDDSAIGFMGSVAFDGPLLRLEGDVEFIPSYAGTDELYWSPQAYAMIGQFIYGGVGVGVGHMGGGFGWQDPWYALRAGVRLGLGGLDLDVFGTYRFEKFGDLEGVTTDDMNSVTLGALVHF